MLLRLDYKHVTHFYLAVLGLALKAQLLCCEEVQQSYHGVRSDAGGPESPADVPVGSQDQLRNM